MKLEDVGVFLILTLLAALVVAGARWADRREERRHQIDCEQWRGK